MKEHVWTNLIVKMYPIFHLSHSLLSWHSRKANVSFKRINYCFDWMSPSPKTFFDSMLWSIFHRFRHSSGLGRMPRVINSTSNMTTWHKDTHHTWMLYTGFLTFTWQNRGKYSILGTCYFKQSHYHCIGIGKTYFIRYYTNPSYLGHFKWAAAWNIYVTGYKWTSTTAIF